MNPFDFNAPQVFSLAAVQSAWWSCLQLVLLGEACFFIIYLSMMHVQ